MDKISDLAAGGHSIVAFLDLIAWSEGTSRQPKTRIDGYDVIVSGLDGPEIFTDFSDHPFAKGRQAKQLNHATPPLRSTASGRYQILLRYWRSYQQMLKLPDFSPMSQDLVAIRQIKERGAFDEILGGKIKEAIALCAPIWASFPGNDYGQHAHPIETLLEQWEVVWSKNIL